MYINKEYEYIYISNSFQWKSLEDNQSEHTKAQISVYNYHFSLKVNRAAWRNDWFQDWSTLK